MTVYKYLLKSFSRNKLIFVIWFGIFALITISIAGFPSDRKQEFKAVQVKIAISEEAYDQNILSLKDTMQEKIKFVELKNDEISARELVFFGGADLAIIRDEESGKLQGYANPTNQKSYIAKSKFNSFLNFVDITGGGEDGVRLAGEISSLDLTPKLFEKASKHGEYALWFNGAFRFLGYPLMAVIMSIIGTGILSFSNKENADRVAISSISLFRLKLWSFFAELVCTFVIFVLSLGILFLIGRSLQFEYTAHILNAGALAMSSLGFIFLLTHINKSKYFIGSASSLIPLCLSFTSGVFVSADFLPELATSIGKLFPLYYYTNANALAIDGFSPEFFRYLGIQAGFAVGYFLLALLIDRLKLLKVHA